MGRPQERTDPQIVSWSTDGLRLAALDRWAAARGLSRSCALDAAVDGLLRLE